MKDWDLWLCAIVYTATLFWFGTWVQRKYDQSQIERMVDASWVDGCRKCARYERDKCERDSSIGGVPEHPRPI